MATGKKAAKNRAAHGRYKSEGRKQKNTLRRYRRKIQKAQDALDRAVRLGRKTKMGKVIAELETAMKKADG